MKIKNLSKKVVSILEEYPETRNSDIALTIKLWLIYERKNFEFSTGRVMLDINKLWDLPREDNIKRIRAKIQNDENRFLPTDAEVRKKRNISEEKWRNFLGYSPELREIN